MSSLGARSTEAERMDTDCADYEDYARCLRDLARVNRTTRTYAPTIGWLDAQPFAAGSALSVLDVAFGHGDMLRRIAAWAAARELRATLVGIDRNPWAARVASAATPDGTIRYETGDIFATNPARHFDYIVSAQFTHHLSEDEIVRFIRWMEGAARKGWFISDLHRHWFPYYGFPLLARAAFWHRFVRTDGQISIARGFRPEEWRILVERAGVDPAAVEIAERVPFRLCVGRTR
ncbi:MAG: methyltransferase domain-containing protein [Acetobacteraceae bacterium]|nr:methyltransferase domain-containing protein [Acetobacteraceae bacterium]